MLQGLESMFKIADTLPIHLLPIILLLYELEIIDLMCTVIQILHRTVWDILGIPIIISTIPDPPTIFTSQECLCLAFVYITLVILHHHGEFSHVNYLIQKEIHWILALESTIQCQVSISTLVLHNNYEHVCRDNGI